MGVNSTYACSPEEGASLFLFSCTMFLNIIIVCKSLFVITMTCRIPELKENVALIFASMSVSDLMLAVILICYHVSTMPFDIFDSLKSNIMTCLIFGVCNGTTFVAMMHFAIMALDGYIHILHPFYYMRYATKRRLILTLVCAWATGLLVMSIPMFVYTDSKYHDTCLFFTPPMIYFGVISSTYAAVLLAVFCFYFKIARLAFIRSKAAINRRLTIDVVDESSLPRINRKSAVRSVQFFIVMFAFYAFCSIPNAVKTWISYFVKMSDNVHRILFFLIPVYSSLNLLTYVKMNRTFSRVVQSTFTIVRRPCCGRKLQIR